MSAALPDRETVYLPPSTLPKDPVVPTYDHTLQPFRNGETLFYQASWLGISAAKVRISFTQDVSGTSWIGQMWLTTNKLTDLFYRMRDYAREEISVSSLRPVTIYVEQYEKQRRDRRYINFYDNGHRVVSTRENRVGKRWIRIFNGGSPLGPFSGSMWALSQRLDPGKTFIFDVFCGGSRYIFALAVRERQKITTPQGEFNTLRVEPSILWTSDSNLLGRAGRLTLWITDDNSHLPIRVEAAVFIGFVRLDLSRVDEVRP
jgi:hypothetical protein